MNDPADPPQPLPGEIKMGSADDPQWQCTVQNYFGGFQGMPWSCQFATKDTQSYEPRKEQSIILINLKINKTQPVIFSRSDKAGYAANSLRSSTLKSTTKIRSDEDDKIIKIETRVPKLPSDLDYFNAENEGGMIIQHPNRSLEKSKRRLEYSQVDDVVDQAIEALDANKDCENFLNAFLNTLGEITGVKPPGNIREILELFRKQGSITNNPRGPKGSGSSGEVDPEKPWHFYFWGANTGNEKLDRLYNAETILHEIIHAIAVRAYGDDAFALAGAKMGLSMTIEEYMKAYPDNVNKYLPKISANLTAQRQLASNLIRSFCPYQKGGYGNAPGIIKTTFP